MMEKGQSIITNTTKQTDKSAKNNFAVVCAAAATHLQERNFDLIIFENIHEMRQKKEKKRSINPFATYILILQTNGQSTTEFWYNFAEHLQLRLQTNQALGEKRSKNVL